MEKTEEELIILKNDYKHLLEDVKNIKNNLKTIEHTNSIDQLKIDTINNKNEIKNLKDNFQEELKTINDKIDLKFKGVMEKLDLMSENITYSKGFIKAVLIAGSILTVIVTVILKFYRP